MFYFSNICGVASCCFGWLWKCGTIRSWAWLLVSECRYVIWAALFTVLCCISYYYVIRNEHLECDRIILLTQKEISLILFGWPLAGLEQLRRRSFYPQRRYHAKLPHTSYNMAVNFLMFRDPPKIWFIACNNIGNLIDF